MAEVAGFTNQVYILAGANAMSGSTGAKVMGVDSSTYSQLCDILEITAFGDTYKNRMGGLKDTSVSISGNYYTGDTNGQLVLVPGDFVFIGVYPSGTTVVGKQVKAIVENYDITAAVADKQTFSTKLSGVAAPVALPLRT